MLLEWKDIGLARGGDRGWRPERYCIRESRKSWVCVYRRGHMLPCAKVSDA